MLGRKQKAASDKIEGEIKILKAKLAEQESRRADVLKALEQARDARRAVLTKDDATVGAATKNVRDLQLEADDLARLVDEYREAIAAAEAALVAAGADEARQAAADTLSAVSGKMQQHIPDLIKAFDALGKVRKAMLADVPAEIGFFPATYANRPEDRPEAHSAMFSGREMINAVFAEGLYGIDGSMFDRVSGGWGSGLSLAKIMDPLAPSPGYKGTNGRPEALTPAEAVHALLISPMATRAKQILAGEAEPVLNDIRTIDRSRPPEPKKVALYITRPVKFVEPMSDGSHFRQVYSEGAREVVIEPIARLLMAKGAALEQGSERGRAWWTDFELRLENHQVRSEIGPERYLDLGDPMGCLEPANDDDIADEVTRALG